MNATIIVLSDPHSSSEEALGRLFNALAAAYDFRRQGLDVRVQFQGTGTRWPAVLRDPEHPAHALFEEVADTIAGVSSGCADVFGAADAARAAGFETLGDNAVPGTSGLPSLASVARAQGTILVF